MRIVKTNLDDIISGEVNMEPYTEFNELVDEYFRLTWEIRDVLANGNGEKAYLLTQKSYALAMLEGQLESVEVRLLGLERRARRVIPSTELLRRGVGGMCEEILNTY